MQQGLKKWGLWLICLAISGCQTMPSRSTLAETDYDGLIAQDIAELNNREDNVSDPDLISVDLTSLISSPVLDRLLTQALVHNPDLQRSWLNLQRYRQSVIQSASQQRPRIVANADTSRVDEDETSFSGDVTISWQIDLWGKLANAVTAAEYDVSEQAFLFQQVTDTLAAEVMRSWLTLISQHRAIYIEQARLATLEKNAYFIEQRYRNGLGSLEDWDEASSAVASAQAGVIELQQNYRQQQRQLQVLVGDMSLTEVIVEHDFPEVSLSDLDMPKHSIARRPDLQAAYQAIKAAQKRTDIAYQALLPSFDLSASLRQIAETPQAWLLTSPAWSLLGQMTAPLFYGGELRADIAQAELETAMLFQTYRETLLTAAKEIDDAIDAEKSLLQRQQYIETALSHKLKTVSLYQQYYRSGLVSILDLLTVQQASYDLQSQQNTVQYQHLMNRIDLGLAMGLGVDK